MARTPGSMGALFRAVLFIVLTAVGLAVVSALLHGSSNFPSQALLGAVTATATGALTLAFLRWEELRPADAGIALDAGSAQRLAVGFGIGLLLVALQTGLVMLSGHIRWERASGAGLAETMTALLAYLLLASREEIAFRGYPLRSLDRAFGLWTAQIVVATLFALEHRLGGYSWMNALCGAFVGSLLFGMAALATRGLAVPIGLHAAYNFGHWIIGEKELPGPWRPIVQPGYEAWIAHAELFCYVVTFALATIAFWFLRRGRTVAPRPENSTASNGI